MGYQNQSMWQWQMNLHAIYTHLETCNNCHSLHEVRGRGQSGAVVHVTFTEQSNGQRETIQSVCWNSRGRGNVERRTPTGQFENYKLKILHSLGELVKRNLKQPIAQNWSKYQLIISLSYLVNKFN